MKRFLMILALAGCAHHAAPVPTPTPHPCNPQAQPRTKSGDWVVGAGGFDIRIDHTTWGTGTGDIHCDYRRDHQTYAFYVNGVLQKRPADSNFVMMEGPSPSFKTHDGGAWVCRQVS